MRSACRRTRGYWGLFARFFASGIGGRLGLVVWGEHSDTVGCDFDFLPEPKSFTRRTNRLAMPDFVEGSIVFGVVCKVRQGRRFTPLRRLAEPVQ
jgi:hypothetical protein